MSIIKNLYHLKHVNFFESKAKFKFKVLAPIEKLCDWESLKLTDTQIYEFCSNTKVEANKDNLEIKYLFLHSPEVDLNDGATWIPNKDYHFACIICKHVWKEGDIEVFQSSKIKFSVLPFQALFSNLEIIS